MKTSTFRTTVLAATAAILTMSAANAGGLGGALGGAVGGTLGGGFGNSSALGGSGNADGFGQGRLGAPDLQRPVGRVRDAGHRVTERGSGVAGKVREGTSDSKMVNPTLGGDGAIGGSTGAETRHHEALLDAGNAGGAHADRSGADASVTPTANAKAGRKAPPVAPSEGAASTK